MTKNAPRKNLPTFAPSPGRASRHLLTALLLGSLAGCAVTPTQTAPEPVQQAAPAGAITSATDLYGSASYSEAVTEYDKVIKDGNASGNDRRLAYLGRAMVYLTRDTDWYSLDNAKLALASAGQVAATGNDGFAAETDLLMDAITAVIGTESKYVELQAKTGNSSAEVQQLKRERDALVAQRDELLAEQQALNDALEKLKQLTLGNN